MFHGRLDYFQKPHVGGGPNTKLETTTLQNLTTADFFFKDV